MNIYRDISALSKCEHPVVLVPGSFDGVHRGHQSLIAYAHERAKAIGGEVWTLTTDPHPSKVLRPDTPTPQLMSTKQKLRHLAALQVDACLLLAFTETFAAIEPETFIDSLTGGTDRLREVITGPNYTFGRRARGNPAWLQAHAGDHGFRASVREPVQFDAGIISSSRIREEVMAGHVRVAHELLGRPFCAEGPIIEGKKLGRELGYPTANMRWETDVRPTAGVYAVYAEIDGVRKNGAGYFGQPSFGAVNPHPVFETHFFDLDADLYGQRQELFFVDKIRDDLRFTRHEDLVVQIEKDLEDTRELFEAI